MDIEQIIMNIIIQSGEARGYAHEALNKANEGDFIDANELMEKSNSAIGEAHKVQTSLLQKEASGDKLEITILFVHAQDHLMTSITEKNLIAEIIELRKKMQPVFQHFNL
jgi:PTS system cellobiose-specific IIA component